MNTIAGITVLAVVTGPLWSWLLASWILRGKMRSRTFENQVTSH